MNTKQYFQEMEKHINNIYIFVILKIIKLFNLNEQ